MSLGAEINVLDLARQWREDRTRLDRITRAELVALLGFVLQENGEPEAQLTVTFQDYLVRQATPSLPSPLVAAIRQVIEARRTLDRARVALLSAPGFLAPPSIADAVSAFNAAISDLQTRFEEEFSNGSK